MADEAVNPRTLAKRGFWSIWEDAAKEGGRWLFVSLLAASGGLTALLATLKVYWPIVVAAVFLLAGTMFILASAVLAIRASASAASRAPAASPSPQQSPATSVTVLTQSSKEDLRGIGFVTAPQVFYDSQKRLFDCSCFVQFISFFEDAVASPHELWLTTQGVSPVVLARLQTDSPARRAGSTAYRGVATLEAMARQIVNSSGAVPQVAQINLPIDAGTYCDLDIRLPSGRELADHKYSKVRLDFELNGRGSSHFRVLVRNLGMEEQPDPKYSIIYNVP